MSDDLEPDPPEPVEPARSVLDEVAAEDRDEGWSEQPGRDAGRGRDDEWYLSERPPHHS